MYPHLWNFTQTASGQATPQSTQLPSAASGQQRQWHQYLSVFVLAGILSLSTGLALTSTAQADSVQLPTRKATNSPLVIANSPTAIANLPATVKNGVLQAAAKKLVVSAAQVRIVHAERQTWSDGCLGLPEPDTFCTQALVPGWRVTVESKQQRLVYRTNTSGSVVKLETGTHSNVPTAPKAMPLPQSDLPPPLPAGVVFRSISSGGIAAQTYETILFQNGRLVRMLVLPNSHSSQTKVQQLSQKQVQQFQQLLEQQKFQRFHRLSYPAPAGAADFFTVTLTSRSGTARYADIIQDQLPEPLQKVIQGWIQLQIGTTSS